MNVLEEIRSSGKNPKELVTFLAEGAKRDGKLLGQLDDCLKIGSVVERGICMEALEYVSKDRPELVKPPRLDAVIEHLNDEDAPKVKWEAARVVGNVAQKFPAEASKAVPKLLLNAKDKGTVVRWSAAYALSEIAKHNDAKMRKSLLPKIAEMAKNERNNGVRTVYLKALKSLEK